MGIVLPISCKACAGEIDVTDEPAIGICKSCGYQQTFPQLGDEKTRDLYDQAGKLRQNAQFDQALVEYEKAFCGEEHDPEAQWSRLLCKYGARYLNNPETQQTEISCGRTLRASILDDPGYQQLLDSASEAARKIYATEAVQIDQIQKEILDYAEQQEPYDIFICYKQTDKNGEATKDSVRAHEIYNALTNHGYRVFFSKITLRTQLSIDFEKYIYAALLSVKVMIVVGTSREHFEAPWVKNEWDRFLKMMEEDDTKHLIPAYEGISAAEMPEEFNMLQASNMGYLAFTMDLLDVIERLIPGKAASLSNQPSVVAPGVAQAIPLIQRARLYCEDGEFNKAHQSIDKALDLDPENSESYLIDLMADYKCRQEEQLGSLVTNSLAQNSNYKKAMRFGNASIKEHLENYAAQAEANYIAEKQRQAEEKRRRVEAERQRQAEERQRREEAEAKAKRVAAKRTQVEAFLNESPYTWRMLALDEANHKALAITKDIIGFMPYHEPGGKIAWADCTLRGWLNTNLFQSLPDQIKSLVLLTYNNQNDSGIPGAADSGDKVFLLSIGEAEKYFSGKSDRVATFNGAVGWWWLRSPGFDVSYAAYVDIVGSVFDYGRVSYSGGVRPALWLNLKSEIFESD